MRTRKRSAGNTPYYKNNNNHYNRIVQQFMELLMTVKLYHWKTKSFPEHKNTDELYSSLNEHIDSFIEVMLGKIDGARIHQPLFNLKAYNYSSVKDLKRYITNTKKELVDMNHLFTKEDSDLLNIRDEILGDVNKFTYLLSFR